MQKVAYSRLVAEGFVVDAVSNGVESVEMVNSQHYDLILIDIGLPDIDGFEIAKYICHESLYNRSTPIIALTSHSEASIHEELLHSPILAALVKPLSIPALMDIVVDHLDR